MKQLDETIKTLEDRLAKPDKSPESRAREESYLHHLKAYRSLLRRITDDMLTEVGIEDNIRAVHVPEKRD